MKLKKIPARKRIKISFKITEAFGFSYWQTHLVKDKIENDFGMQMTSRNWNSIYFKVVDQKKFMMFKIAYGEYIKN